MRRRYSEVQKRLIAAKQNWACLGALCAGKCALPGQWELDHIVPLATGGRDEASNLQVLCPQCHRFKTQMERVNFYFERRLEIPPKLSKPKSPRLYYHNNRWIANSPFSHRRRSFAESRWGRQAQRLAEEHLRKEWARAEQTASAESLDTLAPCRSLSDPFQAG